MANATNTSANRYKGNDIDSDGDGRVSRADHASNATRAEAADDADALGGNAPDHYLADADLADHADAGNPHPNSASADEVPSFETENGSFNAQNMGVSTTSVTFSNTYQPNAFIPSVGACATGSTGQDDGTMATVQSLSTDANGNVTGMTIEHGSDSTDSDNVNWYVMGVPA